MTARFSDQAHADREVPRKSVLFTVSLRRPIRRGACHTNGRHFGKIGTIAKDGRVLLLSTDEAEEVGMQFLSDWSVLLPAAKE